MEHLADEFIRRRGSIVVGRGRRYPESLRRSQSHIGVTHLLGKRARASPRGSLTTHRWSNVDLESHSLARFGRCKP